MKNADMPAMPGRVITSGESFVETLRPEARAVSAASKAGYTPGPWEWIEDRFWGGYSGLFDSNGNPVLVPQHSNDGDDGAAWFETYGDAGDETLTESNARLIAAAPALAEALKDAVCALQCCGKDYPAEGKAVAALRAAGVELP